MKALSEKLILRFNRVINDASLRKCRGVDGVDDSVTKQFKRRKLKQVTLLYFTIMMVADSQGNKVVFNFLAGIKKIPECHEYFVDFYVDDYHLVRLSDHNMNNPVALDNICHHLKEFLGREDFSEIVEIDEGMKDLLKKHLRSCDGNIATGSDGDNAEVNGLKELFCKLKNIENSPVSENNYSDINGSSKKRPWLFSGQNKRKKRIKHNIEQGASLSYW